jgi:RimJ/RimL family protein N-acetyltransferase
MLSIQTKDFQIRPWQPEDAASLAANASHPGMADNLRDSFPYPYTEQHAKDFIARVGNKSPQQEFAIVINGSAVGGISITPLSDVERFSAEIGYWIGETYRNRGITTRALRTFAGYIFQHTNIVRLFACVYATNLPSARVLEKAGFRKVGTLQKAAFKNNRFVDILYYERING